MSKIIVLIGASGSGKSTLDNHLRTLSSRVQPITSVTTRKQRDSDQPFDYEYVTKDEFKTLTNEQKLLWQSQYGDNWYGTIKQSVLEALDSPTRIGTMILVPEVIEKFRNYLQSINRLNDVHFFYIDIDDEVRKERALQRDGTLENFEKRLAQDKAQKDELFRQFADQIIILENNRDIEGFLTSATKIITSKIPKIDKDSHGLAK